jgi:hypothetical protein
MGVRTKINVSGTDSKEVASVSRKLAKAAATERRERQRMRSPWVAGSFYLAVAAVVLYLLLVAAKVLSLWALPLVLLTALLFFMVVGAYQMHQDDKLSEKSFLRLMGGVLKRVPLILKANREATTDTRDDRMAS